jgi:hypothetical protein
VCDLFPEVAPPVTEILDPPWLLIGLFWTRNMCCGGRGHLSRFLLTVGH